MKKTTPAEISIERRLPVWEALSDLWRDTELQDYEVKHIANVLADSGYAEEELREVLAYEVAPVVWTNLFPFYPTIPPVWAGFDRQWLSEEILKSLKRQHRSHTYRFFVRSRFGQWMRTMAVNEDWARVLKAFKEKKSN